jgi:hypothetical protein
MLMLICLPRLVLLLLAHSAAATALTCSTSAIATSYHTTIEAFHSYLATYEQ